MLETNQSHIDVWRTTKRNIEKKKKEISKSHVNKMSTRLHIYVEKTMNRNR